jgi:preprotein translocase subunit SecG
MQTLLLIFQVLLAIGLITLVLLQHGKGADAGAAFGSGASATVFGARGSTSFLSRATAVLATLFFVMSLALAILANKEARQQSVTGLHPAAPVTAPAPETPSQSKGQPASDVPPVPSDVPASSTPAQSSDVPAAPSKGVEKSGVK